MAFDWIIIMSPNSLNQHLFYIWPRKLSNLHIIYYGVPNYPNNIQYPCPTRPRGWLLYVHKLHTNKFNAMTNTVCENNSLIHNSLQRHCKK